MRMDMRIAENDVEMAASVERWRTGAANGSGDHMGTLSVHTDAHSVENELLGLKSGAQVGTDGRVDYPHLGGTSLHRWQENTWQRCGCGKGPVKCTERAYRYPEHLERCCNSG